MNEQDKIMQYCFFAGVLVFFIFAMCYFSTSRVDGRRSEDTRARIDDCQNINTELQAGTERIQQKANDSEREISGVIERLGDAEKELNRAERAIERCEQILRTAQSRTQSTGEKDK